MLAAAPDRVAAFALQVARHALPALDRASARISVDSPLLETVLGRIEPTLSLRAVRARVVAIEDETPDTKTFWMRPNARFGSHRPGSYVTLRVRIGGRVLTRSYSISSVPRRDGLVAITVKRVAGGCVSNWLADALRPGDVVELSPAQGQFVLPEVLPDKLLLLSAGSGITPVMSLLRQLIAANSSCRVAFVHFARTPADIIFREELERIARERPEVRVTLCVERAGPGWSGELGLFREALLDEAAPDFRALDTFLCGPPAFMRVVMQAFERCGADLSKLRYERFCTDFDPSLFLDHVQVLRFLRSQTESVSNQPRTILEEAERAGVRVPHGCRAGNCGTCRSRKTRGVVVDVTTGRESGPGAEYIYPCVSVARGTVELDL